MRAHNEVLQPGSEIKSGAIPSTHVLHHKTSELLPDDSAGAFYRLSFGKRHFLCRKGGSQNCFNCLKKEKKRKKERRYYFTSHDWCEHKRMDNPLRLKLFSQVLRKIYFSEKSFVGRKNGRISNTNWVQSKHILRYNNTSLNDLDLKVIFRHFHSEAT